MNDPGPRAHWDNVYNTKGEKDVSWYQDSPTPSLELIALTGLSTDAEISDIGGGASRLVDSLLRENFSRPTVLDLSSAALDAAKKRLGDSAARVKWVVADVTTWQPARIYDLWHDRAAFHFLIIPPTGAPCSPSSSLRFADVENKGRNRTTRWVSTTISSCRGFAIWPCATGSWCRFVSV